MKDSLGWQLVYVSPRFNHTIKHIALNTRLGVQTTDKLLAVALSDSSIHLGSLLDGGSTFQPIGLHILQLLSIFSILRSVFLKWHRC
jgi:hypothetical protein